jgi:hypothetical protein
MKNIINLILAILFAKLNLLAQLKRDTIDYNVITETNGYVLNKVTSGNSQTTIKTHGKGYTFFIIDPVRIEQQKAMFTNYKIPVKANDTIMYLEFYINKGYSDLCNSHQWAVFHLNKTSNILKLDKINPKYSKIMFKVFKWTKTEVILKEITEGMSNRVYYLIRE